MKIEIKLSKPKRSKGSIELCIVDDKLPAMATLGKCYIYENCIGQVIDVRNGKINSRHRKVYEIWFRAMRHICNNVFHENYDGLSDMFAYNALWTCPSDEFLKGATEVSPELLDKAKAISSEAGKQIDQIINQALTL